MGLLKDAQLREDMKAAAATFETGNAAARLADVVELMIKSKWPDLYEEFKQEQAEKAEQAEKDSDSEPDADSSLESESDTDSDADAQNETDIVSGEKDHKE